MPLYEFKCLDCTAIFEKLSDSLASLGVLECPSCKSTKVQKVISTFSHSMSGGGASDSVDLKIGREAENRWMRYESKKSMREKNREGKDYKEIPVLGPKAGDGKHMPVMALGTDKEKTQRKDYCGALQDHRTERVKKGKPQFDGPGAF